MCEVALPTPVWKEGMTPWHPGEQAVQKLARGKDVNWFFPRFAMDAQHREFFAEQPLLFVATEDDEGRVWASVLAGVPGFITPLDTQHLRIQPMRTFIGDPSIFKAERRIGTLGIQFHTRRRNRLNGIIESHDGDSLIIHTQQSFGNCPKYIQARQIGVDADAWEQVGKAVRPTTRGGPQLGAFEAGLVAQADTFFLATTFIKDLHNTNVSPESRGPDVSHRGGFPGFVQVGNDGGTTTLRWADYPGNNMYQSLGNIYCNPVVGLLFLDFYTGDTLQISGRAEILFDDRSLPGALRTLRVRVDSWVCVKGALPIKVLADTDFMSPYNFGKPVLAASQANGGLASSAQRLACVSVRDESPDVRTYCFRAPKQPGSDQPMTYTAGQYASFDFSGIPDTDGKVMDIINRTWTVSSHPKSLQDSGTITISVKKAGLISSWLWDNMKPGKDIEFKGLMGEFTADAISPTTKAVLLVAGGIGITPLRAMMHEFITLRGLDTVLLYSVRSLEDAAFLPELATLAAQSGKGRVFVTTTRAAVEVKPNHIKPVAAIAVAKAPSEPYTTLLGRIDAAMIKRVAPDLLQREVFMCGPDPFMQAVQAALDALGLPAGKVHTESFAF